MRQWAIDPRCLCTKHIGGEHVEHHMFVGSLKKKISMTGYINNNLVTLKSLKQRHDMLAAEMLSRGGKHQSPLEWNDDLLNYLPQWQQDFQMDEQASFDRLMFICPKCKTRYINLLDEYIKSEENPELYIKLKEELL